MHKDHDIFVRSVERKTKIKLTFLSRILRRQVVSLCAPLHYAKCSAGPAIEADYELNCYYLWDFGAQRGSNILALSPIQIISMELTDDIFRIQNFCICRKLIKKPSRKA